MGFDLTSSSFVNGTMFQQTMLAIFYLVIAISKRYLRYEIRTYDFWV